MDIPKPHPPKKPVAEPSSQTPIPVGESVPSKPKQPYVLKPHLTDRPLRGNESLAELKKELEKSNPIKRRPVRRNAEKK